MAMGCVMRHGQQEAGRVRVAWASAREARDMLFTLDLRVRIAGGTAMPGPPHSFRCFAAVNHSSVSGHLQGSYLRIYCIFSSGPLHYYTSSIMLVRLE